MNIIITAVCMAIFVMGLWCFGLAFQMPNDTLSLLVFIGGILLASLAFFIPWQLIGHSRRK